jgi:hypothetical protein
VSNAKYPCGQRFFLRAVYWNPMMEVFFLLGQQLIPFVHENYCNCAGWRVVRLKNGVVHALMNFEILKKNFRNASQVASG